MHLHKFKCYMNWPLESKRGFKNLMQGVEAVICKLVEVLAHKACGEVADWHTLRLCYLYFVPGECQGRVEQSSWARACTHTCPHIPLAWHLSAGVHACSDPEMKLGESVEGNGSRVRSRWEMWEQNRAKKIRMMHWWKIRNGHIKKLVVNGCDEKS